MNDNARAWVEALRSGNYEQTHGTLHDGTGYCCLGVAAAVRASLVGKGHWERVGRSDGHAFMFPTGDTHSVSGGFLNGPMLDWLGLSRDDQRVLASMNDAGASFSEIADKIEELLS